MRNAIPLLVIAATVLACGCRDRPAPQASAPESPILKTIAEAKAKEERRKAAGQHCPGLPDKKASTDPECLFFWCPDELTESFYEKAAKGGLYIGMSKCLVNAFMPRALRRSPETITAYGRQEIWYWGDNADVVFEDGRVASMTIPRE